MDRRGLYLLALSGCVDPDVASIAEPIIGGQPSPAGNYPATGAMLSVYDFGGGQQLASLTCTGTLIAPDVVLMAAHCTIDFFGGSVPKMDYFTFATDVSAFGMQSNELPPDAIPFEALVANPGFDFQEQPAPGLQNYQDVGLGFLSQIAGGVTPAVVADDLDAPRLTVGATVEIVGYGQRDPAVMEAGLKYEATSFINEIAQYEMQIGDQPPQDPQKCHGDSGGPTYMDVDDGRAPLRRLIGITSRAYDPMVDCNAGGIDMRADAFRSWFDDAMRSRCASGERPAEACTNGGGLPLPGGQLPPVDAGVPDSGAETDAGLVPDGGAPPAMDAGAIDGGPRPDASGGGGGGGRRKKGCGCEGAEGGGSAPAALAIVAILLARRLSAVRGGLRG
jgi:secreted trypsin-like serine protease